MRFGDPGTPGSRTTRVKSARAPATLATPLSRRNSIVVVIQSIKGISGVSRVLILGGGGEFGDLVREKVFNMVHFRVHFVSIFPKKFSTSTPKIS